MRLLTTRGGSENCPTTDFRCPSKQGLHGREEQSLEASHIATKIGVAETRRKTVDDDRGLGRCADKIAELANYEDFKDFRDVIPRE